MATPRTKFYPIYLLICWTAVQVWLLFTTGIKTDLESAKYIREADNILNTGTVSTPNFWFYSTQIFLIASLKKIGIGLGGVVILQMLLNLFATFTLYNYLKKHTGILPAFITSLFLIFNIFYNEFNTFLQTESVYFSLVILYTCYLLKLENFKWYNFFAISAFLALLTFTRPTALLLYTPTFLYILFFKINSSVAKKLSLLSILLLIALYILNYAMGSGGEWAFMEIYKQEMVICGVPVNNVNVDITDNPNSIKGLVYYITQNFNQFAILAVKKTVAFFGVYRAYFSTGHNVVIVCFFSLMYLLATVGIVSWRRQNAGVLFYCLLAIFFTWLSVIVTCDDWHNRFVLTIVPYLLILSAKGVEMLCKNYLIKTILP